MVTDDKSDKSDAEEEERIVYLRSWWSCDTEDKEFNGFTDLE